MWIEMVFFFVHFSSKIRTFLAWHSSILKSTFTPCVPWKVSFWLAMSWNPSIYCNFNKIIEHWQLYPETQGKIWIFPIYVFHFFINIFLKGHWKCTLSNLSLTIQHWPLLSQMQIRIWRFLCISQKTDYRMEDKNLFGRQIFISANMSIICSESEQRSLIPRRVAFWQVTGL